jgi:hypothetical protein
VDSLAGTGSYVKDKCHACPTNACTKCSEEKDTDNAG